MVSERITKDYYLDLGEIPIYNFDKCISGELQYMLVNRCDRKNFVICDDIQSAYDKMYNEWCLLTSNNEILSVYNKILKLNYLMTRANIVPLLLKMLLQTPKQDSKDIYKSLRKLNINIYSEEDVEKALKQIEASRTKINILNDQIEEDVSKFKVDVRQSIQEQSIIISRNLNLKADIYKDSVLHWLGYFKELEKVKRKGKNE